MSVINIFVWFLSQAAGGALGVPVYWFLAATVLLLLLALWKLPKTREARRRLPLLLVLPAYWIFTGMWGAYFWYDWEANGPRNPEWVLWPVNVSTIIFALTFAGLMISMKGGRLFTLIFGIWNLYFMLVMQLLATMAITGAWL